MIGHIRPQCHKLKREQNHVTRSLPKKPSGPKHIVCHHCGAFGHLRPQCFKFNALKGIKRTEKLKLFRSGAMKAKPVLGENGKLLKKVFNFLPPCRCASLVLTLPTLVSLLMRLSFQKIFLFG